jgi:hypothetical protein
LADKPINKAGGICTRAAARVADIYILHATTGASDQKCEHLAISPFPFSCKTFFLLGSALKMQQLLHTTNCQPGLPFLFKPPSPTVTSYLKSQEIQTAATNQTNCTPVTMVGCGSDMMAHSLKKREGFAGGMDRPVQQVRIQAFAL